MYFFETLQFIFVQFLGLLLLFINIFYTILFLFIYTMVFFKDLMHLLSVSFYSICECVCMNVRNIFGIP